MKQLKNVLIVFSVLFLSLFYAEYAHADYAIPGCADAYKAIAGVSQVKSLATLVENDCAILYTKEWRLPVGSNTGGTKNPRICAPAWNNLIRAGVGEDVKFTITHNCPVLYRKGWVK